MTIATTPRVLNPTPAPPASAAALERRHARGRAGYGAAAVIAAAASAEKGTCTAASVGSSCVAPSAVRSSCCWCRRRALLLTRLAPGDHLSEIRLRSRDRRGRAAPARTRSSGGGAIRGVALARRPARPRRLAQVPAAGRCAGRRARGEHAAPRRLRAAAGDGNRPARRDARGRATRRRRPARRSGRLGDAALGASAHHVVCAAAVRGGHRLAAGRRLSATGGSIAAALAAHARYLVLPTLAIALPLACVAGAAAGHRDPRGPGAAVGPAARARGLGADRLLWRHALRLSLGAVLSIYGIVVASVLSGSFAVEVVMSWPGLGALMYEALVARDMYLVAGCAAAVSTFLALGVFASDLGAGAGRSAPRGLVVTRSRRAGLALLAALRGGATLAPGLATHDPAVQFSELRPGAADAAAASWTTPAGGGRRSSIRCDSRIGSPGSTPSTGRTRRPCAGSTPARSYRWNIRRGSRSAPMRSGVTSSRASSWAPGCRSGVAALATAGALLLGGLIGGVAGVAGGRIDDAVDAGGRRGDRAAGDLRHPGPAGGAATRAVDRHRLLVDDRGAGAGRLAGRGPRRTGDRRPARTVESTQKLRAQKGRAVRGYLLHHLLPATTGFLGVQATLLVPGFILAEATLSYVGLGFVDVSPSWGVMLQDAAGGRILAEAPWLLTPAIAIAITVLSVNLIAGDGADLHPTPALYPQIAINK